jgi:hypothetical protein
MQNAAFSIVNYQFDKVNIDLANHSCKELSLSFDTNGLYVNENSTYELRNHDILTIYFCAHNYIL